MMTEREFADAVWRAGGEAYLVGGCVRDAVRNVSAHDRDYVVTGLTEETFCETFPDVFRTGRAFPVYRLEVGGALCEVAFARSETKCGTGYRGFAVSFSERTTIEDDLRRRDTTINSIACSLRTGERIDPYGGVRDIENGIIRATSEHFAHDPVRALRAARQAAQFGFRIEPGTVALMRACGPELAAEPRERLAGELARAMASPDPSRFFVALKDADILGASYPQLLPLIGSPGGEASGCVGEAGRPDAFACAMNALDGAARISPRPEIRFAALVRAAGASVWRQLAREMPLPKRVRACAVFAAKKLPPARLLTEPCQIVDFLVILRGHPIGPDGATAVLRACCEALPACLAQYDAYLAAIESVKPNDIPPTLQGRQIATWFRKNRIQAVEEMFAQKTQCDCRTR